MLSNLSSRRSALPWLSSLGAASLLLFVVLFAAQSPDAALSASTLHSGQRAEPAGVPSPASPAYADFVPNSPSGFGNMDNEWAWSMTWWDGYLYVGTSRQFTCVDQLARARNSFGLITYPPSDPDLSCPADPLRIDMRAEIWRWHAASDTWERVYQSPQTLVTYFIYLAGSIFEPELGFQTIPPTLVARDLGYRGMTVFQEPDGTHALYVTAISPKFAGYEMGPPRILRSTDGLHFAPVPMDPGTMLGNYTKTSLRNPITHIGTDGVRRLYVQGGSSRGPGDVLEAVNPALGNDAFRIVTNDGQQISAIGSFNGDLYLAENDYQNGFKLYRTSPDGGAAPYSQTLLIENGGYLPAEEKPNNEVLSILPFQGYLYFGGNGVRLTGFNEGNLPAELFRIDPQDNWDVIVGAPRADTPDGPKTPLSGLGPGFNNDLNGHMWRMSIYGDELYVSTLDTSYIEKDDSPTPALIAEMGFDLWRTSDGINFTPVTTDAFSANLSPVGFPRPDLHPGAFDIGGRTQASTDYGLFLGTVNAYQGLRVWQAQRPPATITVAGAMQTAVDTPVTLTATVGPPTATIPLTYTWEATNLPGSIVHDALLTDVVTLTWSSAGSQLITVTATNEAGASQSTVRALDVLAPEPNVAPASIVLIGPESGNHYEPATFTASVFPLTATQPLTYVWQATDLAPITLTGGLQSQVDLTWEDDGLKSVTVEVTSPAGVYSDTRVFGVVACAPIESLRLAQRPGNEAYTNGSLYVEAVTEGGLPPFLYAWQLNDGPVEFLGSRYLLAGTGPGVQNLTVQVTNLCGEVGESLPVLVSAPDPAQVELSTSSAMVRPAVAAPGEALTFTLFLRNTNELPLTTTVSIPIPANTSYVMGSAESSLEDPPVPFSGNLLWTGPVRPGITALITYSVIVDAGTPPGNTILSRAYLGSGKDRYNISVDAEAGVAPDYGLTINDDALVTAIPTVTLRYAWDEGTDISAVRLSNDPGFVAGGDANTTDWLPVNPGDPTISDWPLATAGVAYPPRTVYAIFRNEFGHLVGPRVEAQIFFDSQDPFVSSLVIDLNGARPAGPEAVPVTVIVFAGDNLSGLSEIQLSSDPSFVGFSSFPATGNATIIDWNLENGTVYGRARDRAGNLSAVATGQFVGPSEVMVSGPTTGTLNELLSFTAVVSPSFTTRPITFTWQSTGQPGVQHVVDGPSDTVNYTWLNPGTKSIQVTAVNNVGSSVGSTQVLIQVPELTLDPASFEIYATVGEVVSATLTIGNTGAGALNWSASELPPTSWLYISPSSGTTDGGDMQPVTITVDTTGLMPTTYSAAIRVASNDPDEGIVDLPLTLHVLPVGPQLLVTPEPITAAVTSGEMTAMTATITNVGDQTLGWSVAVDPPASWLAVAPASGILLPNASAPLDLTVDAAALPAGDYSTNLRFDSNDSDEPTRYVPVQLTVEPVGPLIALLPASVNRSILAGESVNIALELSNPGDQELSWSATEDPAADWLTLLPATGTLPASGTAPLDLQLDANLPPGVYTTTVVFAGAGPEPPVVALPVTLEVLATTPDATVEPTALDVTVPLGQSTTRFLTIGNAGTGTLAWSLATTPPIGWLTLGTSSGDVSPGMEEAVQLTIDATGLDAGTYLTTLRLTSNDPDEPTIDIPVALRVGQEAAPITYLPLLRR